MYSDSKLHPLLQAQVELWQGTRFMSVNPLGRKARLQYYIHEPHAGAEILEHRAKS